MHTWVLLLLVTSTVAAKVALIAVLPPQEQKMILWHVLHTECDASIIQPHIK